MNITLNRFKEKDLADLRQIMIEILQQNDGDALYSSTITGHSLAFYRVQDLSQIARKIIDSIKQANRVKSIGIDCPKCHTRQTTTDELETLMQLGNCGTCENAFAEVGVKQEADSVEPTPK